MPNTCFVSPPSALSLRDSGRKGILCNVKRLHGDTSVDVDKSVVSIVGAATCDLQGRATGNVHRAIKADKTEYGIAAHRCLVVAACRIALSQVGGAS